MPCSVREHLAGHSLGGRRMVPRERSGVSQKSRAFLQTIAGV
jgi:hypothetical protein